MFRTIAWRHTRAVSGGKQEQPPRDQDEVSALLGTLIATRPGGRLGGLTGSAASAITVHAVLIGGLILATSAESHVAPPEPPVVIDLYADAMIIPSPPPPVNVDVPTAPIDVARGSLVLVEPVVIPPIIPAPQIGVVIRPEDFTALGKEGGVADGRDGAPTLDELMLAPRVVPFTVRPELLNGADVTGALVRFYPTMLRDAGIGGTTLMWFFIDENGRVLKTQVKESSGYPALDEAAQRVAEIMHFSPAQNRERKVQVWIEIPIIFQSR